MKNYYQVLKLTFGFNNMPEIQKSYENLLKQYTLNQEKDPHFIERITLLNEAYLVLTDSSTKHLYDEAFSNDLSNHELEKKIKEKRKEATNFVKRKRAEQKKPLRWWQIAAIIFVLFTCVVAPLGRYLAKERKADKIERTINHTTGSSKSNFRNKVPSEWIRYTFNNECGISIPPTMELKGYPNSANDRMINGEIRIFQQKGLNDGLENAKQMFARILLYWYPEINDISSSEKVHIYNDVEEVMYTLIQGQVGDMDNLLPGYPMLSNIKIGNANGFEAKYMRKGLNGAGSVTGKVLFLYSKRGTVVMVLAYRENERDIWADDMVRVIESFQWIH